MLAPLAPDRIHASDCVPDFVEGLLRRKLVDVEDQIEIGVEVGVAAASRADEQRGPKRHAFERRLDDSPRTLA